MNDKIFKSKKGYLHLKCGQSIARINLEKKLGRKIKPGHVAHHKNRNKCDNRYENLVEKHHIHHDNSHRYSKRKSGRW